MKLTSQLKRGIKLMMPIAAYRTSSPPIGETLLLPSSLPLSIGRTRVLRIEAAMATANGASSSNPALHFPFSLCTNVCHSKQI